MWEWEEDGAVLGQRVKRSVETGWAVEDAVGWGVAFLDIGLRYMVHSGRGVLQHMPLGQFDRAWSFGL